MAIREPEEPPAFDEPADVRANEETAQVAASDPLPSITAMDRLAGAAPRPTKPATLRAAWIMTFVILTAAAAGVFVWRDPLTRAWPPAGRILGSPTHPPSPATPLPAKASEPALAPKQ
jgi:hypothetical protein